jgi:hypothetical protein
LVYLTSPALAGIPHVAHAFSTRRADGSGEFDLGSADSEAEPYVARRRRLTEAAGLAGVDLPLFRQVHGAKVLEVGAPESHGGVREADAFVSFRDSGATVVGVRTADCLAILLADRAGAAVAAVHAGWRGTARGVARAAVAKLTAGGVSPGELVAALGPAAGGCCYEVGDEVVAALAEAGRVNPREISRRGPGGTLRLDLVAANRVQLEQEGIPAASIDVSGHCTICSGLFHSFRRDGESAGRMMACIGFRGLRSPESGEP